MKSLIAILVLLSLCVSCSTTKVTDPALSKPAAQGTPNEGDGGGGGGGGQPDMVFNAYADGPTVGVSLDNFNASGAFGFQFTFRLSEGLALNGSVGQAVQRSAWLAGSNSILSATQNQDGSYTVVGARWVGGGDCAHAGGELVTIETTGSGTLTMGPSPSGTPSPTLRDCSNSSLPIFYGTAVVNL